MSNISWANEEVSEALTVPSVQSTETHIDYDIHEVVAVRLIDCPQVEAAEIGKKFGSLQHSLSRTPDIIVRFVQQLPAPGLTHLGLRQYAYTENDFFLIAEKNAAKTKIDFVQIGSRTCEIVCESGTPIVALLTTLINLTALKKNYVSLQASAFSYRGVGVLVAGWKKGGKTESLLAFAQQGVRYIGDEWILLSADGTKMHGIPGVIPVWDWHFKYLPQLRRKVAMRDRLLFAAVRGMDKLQRGLPHGRLGNMLPIRFLRDALPPLKKRLNVALEAEAIFASPLGSLSARPDKFILAMSHADQEIRVEPADPMHVAGCMSSSVQFEQLGFFKHYLAFKFAFPDRQADFMETIAERQQELLRRALSGKDAYLVSHPYPVSLSDLSAHMVPILTAPALKRVA